MARPKKKRKDRLHYIFATRLKPAEAKVVKEAIEKSGQKHSEWLRKALIKVATEK